MTSDLTNPGLPALAARSDQIEYPIRVLFLCTGNSARSQIAEALLVKKGGDRIIEHEWDMEKFVLEERLRGLATAFPPSQDTPMPGTR